MKGLWDYVRFTTASLWEGPKAGKGKDHSGLGECGKTERKAGKREWLNVNLGLPGCLPD